MQEEGKVVSEDTKNQLTDSQVEEITETLDEIQNDDPNLKLLKDLNDGSIVPETEQSEQKLMQVHINPETGEHSVVGEVDPEDTNKDIKDIDILDISEPITESEIGDYLTNLDSNTLSDLLSDDTGLTAEEIHELLEVVNRRIKHEDFNVYKALPEKIRDLVDNYMAMGSTQEKSMLVMNYKAQKTVRNTIAETLIDEFISNIQMDRAKHDFATELEKLYQEGGEKISTAGIEYIDERNKAYREAANEIEDEDKKFKLLTILDTIDSARNLNELKEYAKTCKLKKIELEKPYQRVFNNFLLKYKDSPNNIYHIDIAYKVLARHLAKYNENHDTDYTDLDAVAFLVAFCKQVSNYSVSVATDHAYMYYVLYYCAMLDGDKSDKFINNAVEVINNLRERNRYNH
jgi:hypothetical protein